MSKPLNLLGQRFGRLVVIERAENNKHGQTRWKCKCDCGKFTVVAASDLKNGGAKSCGCWHDESAKLSHTHFTKHGMTNTKIFRNWLNLKNRCFDSKHKSYKNYGGRGITICDEWRNDFQAFYDYVSKLEHYGEDGYSLDRINNDGNYEPGNVRWADKKTQARNRHNNHIVNYNGVDMTLAEAIEKSGINQSTLYNRLSRGDSGEKLFRPVRKKH